MFREGWTDIDGGSGFIRAMPLALLLLTGCATTNAPPPAVEIRTQVKTVEVQRPCSVTKPVRPAPLTKPIPTDAIALAAALALKLAEWSGPGGYGDRASAAIDSCTKP